MQNIESLNRLSSADGSASLFTRANLNEGFAEPAADLGTLLNRLGSLAFTIHWPVTQYVTWADTTGLFGLMERRGAITIGDISRETLLTEAGSDALLGVLCALGLATRSPAGRYALTADAREYCLRSSPYCIVDQFGADSKPIPSVFFGRRKSLLLQLRHKVLSKLPALRYGSAKRLLNQHARNLPACTAAVRTGEFNGMQCLVDIAGGSGAFSIPLALDNCVGRIVLAELPQALPNIRPYLSAHGLQHRVELLGLNALEYPWRIPPCDGIFIGNFLHGFNDETCRRVCEEAFRHLAPGGKIWIHEMIWNANKDGPLVTAMWNAAMRNGPGRQRTARELAALLESAGFADPRAVATISPFSLIAARKPGS